MSLSLMLLCLSLDVAPPPNPSPLGRYLLLLIVSPQLNFVITRRWHLGAPRTASDCHDSSERSRPAPRVQAKLNLFSWSLSSHIAGAGGRRSPSPSAIQKWNFYSKHCDTNALLTEPKPAQIHINRFTFEADGPVDDLRTRFATLILCNRFALVSSL